MGSLHCKVHTPLRYCLARKFFFRGSDSSEKKRANHHRVSFETRYKITNNSLITAIEKQKVAEKLLFSMHFCQGRSQFVPMKLGVCA